MSYLLPTTADTTPPTIVGFKYPANLSTATANDPVEIELTAYDERGDMDYVDLKVGDTLIQRTEVYPFQFRYTPPASAIGVGREADRGGRGQGGQQVHPRPVAQRARFGLAAADRRCRSTRRR